MRACCKRHEPGGHGVATFPAQAAPGVNNLGKECAEVTRWRLAAAKVLGRGKQCKMEGPDGDVFAERGKVTCRRACIPKSDSAYCSELTPNYSGSR